MNTNETLKPPQVGGSALNDGLGEQEYEYRVICDIEEGHFKRMIEMHLNDGTGWNLSGGVSIAVQFTSVRYAQALIRKKLTGA